MENHNWHWQKFGIQIALLEVQIIFWNTKEEFLHSSHKLNLFQFWFSGIFFTEGPLWHDQRRFTLRNLRDFGFGRRHEELELDFNDEILNLIDLIDNGPKYRHEKVTRKCFGLRPNLLSLVAYSSFFITEIPQWW